MSDPLIVPLPDLAATETLARRLASVARAGDCILLEGPLGAGKTALARAFLREAMGDEAMEVPSPSFTLVQIYETKIGPAFHYDLWRLDRPDSLAELDWEGALDAIVLVEWPDRLGPLRPRDALTIKLRMGVGEAREATLVGWEERMASLVPALRPVVSLPSMHGRRGADGRDTAGQDDGSKSGPKASRSFAHDGAGEGGRDTPGHDEGTKAGPRVARPCTPDRAGEGGRDAPSRDDETKTKPGRDAPA